MNPDALLGMDEKQRPVLIIQLGCAGDRILTIQEAREFAALILNQCLKADRGFATNDG